MCRAAALHVTTLSHDSSTIAVAMLHLRPHVARDDEVGGKCRCRDHVCDCGLARTRTKNRNVHGHVAVDEITESASAMFGAPNKQDSSPKSSEGGGGDLRVPVAGSGESEGREAQ